MDCGAFDVLSQNKEPLTLHKLYRMATELKMQIDDLNTRVNQLSVSIKATDAQFKLLKKMLEEDNS